MNDETLRLVLEQSHEVKDLIANHYSYISSNDYAVIEFIKLYVLKKDERLSIYASNKDLGKWQELASSLLELSILNEEGIYIEDSLLYKYFNDDDGSLDFITLCVEKCLSTLFDWCKCYKKEELISLIKSLYTFLESLPFQSSLLCLDIEALEEKDNNSFIQTFMKNCLNHKVYEFYIRCAHKKVFPQLEWNDFQKVLMVRLGMNQWTEGMEHLIDFHSLSDKQIKFLLDLNWLSDALLRECIARGWTDESNDGYKEASLDYKARLMAASINTIEDAIIAFPTLNPLQQFYLYKKFEEPISETLGELPIRINKFNVLLLESGYKELGIKSKPKWNKE